MKIIFSGTPEFGLPCLQALAAAHEVIAVYTQPDRPAGRGQKLKPSPIKAWAETQGIPVYQPLNFKEESALTTLENLQADLMVVIAYGLILPVRVLAAPRLGCINVHASLLPLYRGASPIQQAILQGDKISGVSIMQMDKGLDTGPVFTTASCELTAQETTGSLHDKLALLSINPLMETLAALEQGQALATPQDAAHSSYAGKINKEDAHLLWNSPTATLDRQIRAYQPWPVAYTQADDILLKIHAAEPDMTHPNAAPGTILDISRQGICVATQDGILRITTIQLPGGKPLPVSQWFNAHKDQLVRGQQLQ